MKTKPTAKEKCNEGYACHCCGHDAWYFISNDRNTYYVCSNITCEGFIRDILGVTKSTDVSFLTEKGEV